MGFSTEVLLGYSNWVLHLICYFIDLKIKYMCKDTYIKKLKNVFAFLKHFP